MRKQAGPARRPRAPRRQRTEGLRLLVARAPHAVVTIDARGRIASWTPQAERLFGWSPKEVLGRRWSQTISPPAHRAAHERALAGLLATGQGEVGDRRIELTVRRRNGTEFPMELAMTLARPGAAVVGAFLPAMSDRTGPEGAPPDGEAGFRRLFASTPLAMWVYDQTTLAFLEVNEATVARYGYSRDEFLRMRIPDIVAGDAAPRSRDPVTNASGDGRLERGEERHRLKDGRILTVRVASHSVQFAGRRARVMVADDLSEGAPAAADPVPPSEKHFRSLVASVTDYAILMLDPEGRVATWNAGAERIKGYRAEEIIGHHVSRFYPDEDVRRGKPATALERARQVGRVEDEGWRVRKDGSRFWANVVITAVRDPAGRLQGFSKVTRDITERKRAEEALRDANTFLDSIVENIPHMICVKDAQELRFVRFNQAGERLLGYARDELIGKNDYDVFPQSEADFFTSKDRDVLAGRALVDIPEEPIATRARGTRILHTKKIPIGDDAGGPRYLLAISEDITERKQAEEALRQARQDAEEANRAKSEFLSRMSHELRTPLNAILGFAQLLELDVQRPADRESVDQILKGGRHLLSLVNEILDIARIEAGQLPLSPEPVCVGDAVQRVLDLARPLATAAGIELDVAGAGLYPEHVWADNQRLQQVLLNLVSNGIKYNGAGGRLTVACEAAADRRLRLSVADRGPGIAPELQARLFQPFDRLGAERRGVEGTGLGLVLSKRLVEAMGGTIGVRSTPGEGSTFWVELVQAENPVDRHELTEPTTVLARSTAARNGTVLYVEDNLSNLRLVERTLALRPAVKLIPAMQGRLGLALARQHRPDLILLDLHLPDISGEQVLGEVQGDPALGQTPVIILSADATPGQVQRLHAAGVRGYLTKPLDVRQLLALLDETLLPREVRDG
jgi:PAS domain S-box-containing protein